MNNLNIQTDTSTTVKNQNLEKPVIIPEKKELNNIHNDYVANNKQDEHKTNNEKSPTHTTTEYKCTLCNTEFSDLSKCLNHELTSHISTIEKTRKPQIPGRKRKSKQRNLSLSGETEFDVRFRNTVTSSLSECPENYVLQTFCQLFQPTTNDLNKVYNRIYDDLKFELHKIGKYKWEIHPFGSTINSMALKTSDMDFYIHCLSSSINKNILSNTNYSKKLFYKVKVIFFSGNLFSNVIAIPRARVPVIKCTHISTGINLDINLMSRIGVFNSKFIGKVISFDNRIHPFLLVLKVWAKLWEITKTGRITNYCLTLLVFFYLQNCQPPVLPSIKKFQENCEEILVDGYNFGFKNPENFDKFANTENIIELLKGFFKFYTNYNYETYILCPYLGMSIEKSKFIENKFIYPEYQEQINKLNQSSASHHGKNEEKQASLKLDTSIVIQDPFCLTLNKFNTGPHVFAHFYNRLEIANKIMIDNSSGSFGKLLIKLLYETKENTKTIVKKSNPVNISTINPTADISNYTNIQSNPLIKNSCTLNPLETELTFIRNYLRIKYPNTNFDTNEIKKKWCEHIMLYLVEILEKIYKIKLNNITNEYSNKSLKNNDQSDIHSNDSMIKIYKITSNLNLWSNRKNINTKRGYATYLEKTLETTTLLENQRKLNPLFQAQLNCELIFRKAQDYSSMNIEMINQNGKIGKQSFKTLFNEYLSNSRSTIIAYFERLSREH